MKTRLSVFLLSIFIIVLVSAYDTYANMKSGLTPDSEVNPLARLVLVRTCFAGLIAAKLFGTAMATGLLCLAFASYQRLTLIVSVILAFIQIGVVAYLLS